jgi:hypothetical protein
MTQRHGENVRGISEARGGMASSLLWESVMRFVVVPVLTAAAVFGFADVSISNATCPFSGRAIG